MPRRHRPYWIRSRAEVEAHEASLARRREAEAVHPAHALNRERAAAAIADALEAAGLDDPFHVGLLTEDAWAAAAAVAEVRPPSVATRDRVHGILLERARLRGRFDAS